MADEPSEGGLLEQVGVIFHRDTQALIVLLCLKRQIKLRSAVVHVVHRNHCDGQSGKRQRRGGRILHEEQHLDQR